MNVYKAAHFDNALGKAAALSFRNFLLFLSSKCFPVNCAFCQLRTSLEFVTDIQKVFHVVLLSQNY
jgi:hypothetical protein